MNRQTRRHPFSPSWIPLYTVVQTAGKGTPTVPKDSKKSKKCNAHTTPKGAGSPMGSSTKNR